MVGPCHRKAEVTTKSGANWVHRYTTRFDVSQLQTEKASTRYNPIVELVKETGAPLHLWKESTLLLDGDGHLVAPSEANRALKQVWEILEAAIEHSMHYNERTHYSANQFDFFENWCHQSVQAGHMNRQEMELVLGMSRVWGAYVVDRVEL